MKISHRHKVQSKKLGEREVIKRGAGLDDRKKKNSRILSASLGEVLSGATANQVAVAFTIGVPIISCGYSKIKSYLKRHDSLLVTKCGFILTQPKKVCGCNAEIIQMEIDGKQRIVHQCTEFESHKIVIADRRQMRRLQSQGKYKK